MHTMIALTFLVASAPGQHTEGSNWAFRGPEGGRVEAIAAHPVDSNLVFAATINGLFRSSDGGSTWTRKVEGLTHRQMLDVVVSQALPPTLYALTVDVQSFDFRVFRSRDGAESWQEASHGLQDAFFLLDLEMDPQDHTTVYAAAANGIYKTTNGGDNWNIKATSFSGFGRISASPKDSQFVYALDLFGQVATSSDGGESFRVEFLNKDFLALTADPTDAATVWLADFDGLFKRTGDGPLTAVQTNARGIRRITFAPGDPQVIYLATSGGLARSEDGGATWTRDSEVGGYRFNVLRDLAVDPNNAQTVYASTAAGTLKSVDGGRRWNRSEDGLTAARLVPLLIDPLNPLSFWGAGGSLFRSVDGGQHWNRNQNGLGSSRLGGLLLDPGNPRRLLAFNDFEVLSSEDGGASFSALPSTLVRRPASLAISPADPEVIYLARRTDFSGLLRSRDGGGTWEEASSAPAPFERVLEIRADPAESGFVYLSTTEGIYASFDAGESYGLLFQPDGAGATTLNISGSTVPVLYLGTQDGRIFKSEDRGQSWDEVSEGLPGSSINCVLADDTRGDLYAATREDGVYLSRDGGQSWSSFNAGLDLSAVNALSLEPGTAGWLYASTPGGVYSHRLTEDSNASAQLEATKTVSGNFFPAGSVTYQVVLSNTGLPTQPENSRAQYVDTLPIELELLRAVASAGQVTIGPSANTVTWNGELAAGQSITLSIYACIGSSTEGKTVSSQGLLQIENGPSDVSQRTDDPSTPQPLDATAFRVGETPLVPALLVPFSLGIENTFVGLALANFDDGDTLLRVRGWDALGELTADFESQQILPKGGQDAFTSGEVALAPATAMIGIEGRDQSLEGFFLGGDNDVRRMDGIGAALADGQELFFSQVRSLEGAATRFYLFNPSGQDAAAVTLQLFGTQGDILATASFDLAPFGSLSAEVREIFGDVSLDDGYVKSDSDRPVRGFLLAADQDAFSALAGRKLEYRHKLYAPHFFFNDSGGTTILRVLNPTEQSVAIGLRAVNDEQSVLHEVDVNLAGRQLQVIDLRDLLGAGNDESGSGYLELRVNAEPAGPFSLLAGTLASVTYEGGELKTRSTLPLASEARENTRFLQVAQSVGLGIFQGLAIYNPHSARTRATILARDGRGEITASSSLIISPQSRVIGLLNQDLFFGPGFEQTEGYLEVHGAGLVAFTLFGGDEFLAAVEGVPEKRPGERDR